MKFRTFLNESKDSKEIQEKVALLLYMTENDDMINESYDMENLTEEQEKIILEGIKDWFEKVGLTIEKGDGLLDYIGQFSVGAGRLILAAIKGDKEKVKKIASGMKKEKFLDFLLKLDLVTLHIVTEPIHIIDALTGWDLMANVKKYAEGAGEKIKIFYAAMKKVKDTLSVMLNGKKKVKMLKYATNLENSIPKK
jgi:hypothetical protein